MATIIYKLTGAQDFTAVQAQTLGELKEKLNLKNHTVTIKHGNDVVLTASSPDFQLQDGMSLIFSEQVKGA